VQRLAFGTLDYALDLGLSGDPRGLLYPASRIALASRAAGLAPPVAGITAAIDDEAALRADFDQARACGFGAKLCIHPRQIETVHAMLAPTPEQRDWAERVLAAAESGSGAVQLDGKMVDRPVLLRAQAILDQLST
jgi:citrate lyase subunit beta/citryl-CoA lyase